MFSTLHRLAMLLAVSRVESLELLIVHHIDLHLEARAMDLDPVLAGHLLGLEWLRASSSLPGDGPCSRLGGFSEFLANFPRRFAIESGLGELPLHSNEGTT